MAIALTNSYKKVAEVKMGSWGYGTLYLRTYAKFDENNNIVVQGRIYNNGTYCYSGNCYATVQGQYVKENVKLDFTSKSEIILGTKTVAGGTVKAIVTFKCYAFGSEVFTAKADVTLPTDTALGLDFDIGSATTITITRYNENYTRTVVASIGDYSYVVLEKGTSELETVIFPADKLYEQVTDSNIGEITLTTTTYDGDNVVGETQSQLKCRVTNSNPIINSVSITDATPSIDVNAIIRYITKPTFEINASGVNYATIVKYSVTELNSEAITSDTNTLLSPNTVTSNEFSVTVTDSRGNSSTITTKADNFVEYVLPVISKVVLTRTGENLDKIQVNVDGSWFNSSFISKQNIMLLKYRYKAGSGDYSDYKTLTTDSQPSPFSLIFELEDTFDVNTVYTIEVAIDDYLRTGPLSSVIGKAIALIDHWSEKDKDYYNINAEIQQYGVPILQEQKILWSGATHLVETDTIILDETVSSQQNGIVLVWSGYSNGEAKNWNFTYCFIPKQHIELLNGEGVSMQMCGSAFDVLSSKYAYISNTQITGNEHNNRTGKANGITYDNTAFVLRYVIGV